MCVIARAPPAIYLVAWKTQAYSMASAQLRVPLTKGLAFLFSLSNFSDVTWARDFFRYPIPGLECLALWSSLHEAIHTLILTLLIGLASAGCAPARDEAPRAYPTSSSLPDDENHIHLIVAAKHYHKISQSTLMHI